MHVYHWICTYTTYTTGYARIPRLPRVMRHVYHMVYVYTTYTTGYARIPRIPQVMHVLYATGYSVYHGYARIPRDILGYPWLTMLCQDCCLILPLYPFSLEDPSDMSLEDARPQLFFKCLLRPRNGRPTQNTTWMRGPNDIDCLSCVFQHL